MHCRLSQLAIKGKKAMGHGTSLLSTMLAIGFGGVGGHFLPSVFGRGHSKHFYQPWLQYSLARQQIDEEHWDWRTLWLCDSNALSSGAWLARTGSAYCHGEWDGCEGHGRLTK